MYEVHYCARGNAENLIKLHKSQLASDRTSCRSANANQMRLILHTAAYWLMWRIQQAIPRVISLATAEFATLRLRLLKIAARVIETATRIRVAFASACPNARLSQRPPVPVDRHRAQARACIANAAAPPKSPDQPINPASLSILRDEIDATVALSPLTRMPSPKASQRRNAHRHE